MPLALSWPFYSMGTQRELGPNPLDTFLPSASSKGENIPGLSAESSLAILAKSSAMIWTRTQQFCAAGTVRCEQHPFESHAGPQGEV